MYSLVSVFDTRMGYMISGTGLMTELAGNLRWKLNSLNISLSVETVCVFTASSALASWATYLLTKEIIRVRGLA
ncbi:unnamed protein product [Sphenostylis stenocarpa]|uniref:Uncharacterized protein n=1 Tax=Sphenostylis stenocarpa TaxID=92480 RepID=A0AA86VEJ8_9FABA|nr:unnamed protein product [Sphenostylis stenocarpa]